MEFLIPSVYYRTFFLALISILAIIKILPSGNNNFLSYERENIGLIKTLFLAFFFILFFGLRSPFDKEAVFADTSGYTHSFYDVQEGVEQSIFDEIDSNEFDSTSEFIFRFIRDLFATLNLDVSIWYIIVASIYILTAVWGIRKIFPGHEYLAFLFFICSLEFYSGGTNGIRNADATSLFFLGLTFVAGKKLNWALSAIFCFLAYYTHHSTLILIIALLLSLFLIKNPKISIIIWCISIIISLIYGNIIATYTSLFDLDPRLDKYMEWGTDTARMVNDFAYSGFRWDFLIYSSVPILLSIFVLKNKIYDRTYFILLNTYILSNAIWIFFMYAAFTNRFAMLSWSLYGYLLIYPFIKFKFWSNPIRWASSLLIFQILIEFIL